MLTYTQHYNGLKYYISMCADACFPQLHKCTNAHASRYNTRFNAHCTDLNSNPLRCPPSSFFGHYYDHQADRHVEFPGQAINDNVIKNDIYPIVNLPSPVHRDRFKLCVSKFYIGHNCIGVIGQNAKRARFFPFSVSAPRNNVGGRMCP